MLRRLAVVVVSVWVAGTGIAEAKSYSAERFDSRIRVVDGGALEVTETLTFRFESGTFSRVFRDIPRRRTDGIEILRASMDGRPFPFGTDTNQASIRRDGKSLGKTVYELVGDMPWYLLSLAALVMAFRRRQPPMAAA